MLKALTREYSHIGDIIDIIPGANRMVEYLKKKIKIKVLEEKGYQTMGKASWSQMYSLLLIRTRKIATTVAKLAIVKRIARQTKDNKIHIKMLVVVSTIKQRMVKISNYRGCLCGWGCGRHRGYHTNRHQAKEDNTGNCFIANVSN